MFPDKKRDLKCLKISEILVYMHKFGKEQLITPWSMRKRVQECNARKLTNLSIWMHLSPKNSPDSICDAQGFPNFTYTQKGRRPTLY